MPLAFERIRRFLASLFGANTASGARLTSAVEPLVARALQILDRNPRRTADEVATCLWREELMAASSLEVGLWGPAVFRAAAVAALRLRAVSTSGSDIEGS